MESQDLEKQVESILNAPEFAQEANFEMPLGLGKLLSKDMIVGAVGIAAAPVVTGYVDQITGGRLSGLPVGSSSIIGGLIIKKLVKKDLGQKFATGLMQGGLATLLTPIVSQVSSRMPGFAQEEKANVTQELNPLVKGVMW
jgi:hypothetical protein|tara:strand:+ start:141 stop:563 length:423 start_codon:yes stop_codon:yes gene_type:complete